MIPWTTQRTNTLKALYLSKELPYTKMGLALGCSRNAISGMVKRLIDSGELPRIHEAVMPSGPKPKARKREKKVAPTPLPEPEKPTTQAVTTLEVRDSQCKFPIGDGPIMHCGAPVQSGSSCCPYHHRISRVPNLPRRDAA